MPTPESDMPMDELSPGAAAMERRALVVEGLREADRDCARAAARRLAAVDAFRVEAEAANRGTGTGTGSGGGSSGGGSGSGSGGGSGSGQDGAVGAQARVRFSLSPDVERRAVKAELAMALRISEREAETQLAMAEALATELSASMDALRAGDITERHARLIWDHSCHLPEADRPEFESLALVAARKLSATRLKRKLRDIAERLHPETAIERHTVAVETRDVWVDPLPDGMAILSVRHSVEQILAVQNGIEHCARGLAGDPDEPRTLPQLRADLAVEFLANGEFGEVKITPTAHIVVPALSLVGQSEELAILARMGRARALPSAQQVLGPQDVRALRDLADDVFVHPAIAQYAVRLVLTTRDLAGNGLADLAGALDYGASPRSSLGLVAAARALALLRGRGYVLPGDVADLAEDVMAHRIGLSFDALADGLDPRDLVRRVLGHVPQPRIAPAQPVAA